VGSSYGPSIIKKKRLICRGINPTGIIIPASKRTLSPLNGLPAGRLRTHTAALCPVLRSHTDRLLPDRAQLDRAQLEKAQFDRSPSRMSPSGRSLSGRYLLSGMPGPVVVVAAAMIWGAGEAVLSAAYSESAVAAKLAAVALGFVTPAAGVVLRQQPSRLWRR
jgi:hypothetical protein